MSSARIIVPKDQVSDFCRRHHIKKLALFGSVLRDDFRPDSDVDVLVEFEPGRTPGLAFFGMEIELSEILGRKVDLNTAGLLSKYFRDRVLAEAEVQYVAP
ncbi:MAG TPA: nucleotidyltransferase family protein [Candidatus Binataceae bacterium]|nr:nucleotidyltransferase family protein [Candidatus Binataceae bacterium]